LRHRPIQLLILTLPFLPYAHAAKIDGTVFSVAQAPVSGATVTIKNSETNAERAVPTNELGNYAFPFLSPGNYELRVALAGFQTAARPDIRLRVDDTLRIDFSLLLETQRESVEVRAAGGILDTESAVMGQVMERQQIIELPLNQRNFQSLALLAPGVSPPTYGSFTAKQGGTVNVSGGREMSNQFLLDGVDNSDPRLHQISLSPPLESIDQFKVQSSNSSIEFGRSSAGQINLVLKSGTNALHGSLFEFVRNRNMDARNYFDPPACKANSVPGACADKPGLDRNQFGGSLGGALKKNRAFFFATYEGLRLRQAVTRRSTVPSQNQRAAALQAVPVSQQNPAGLAALGLYPLANVGGNDPSSNIYVGAPLIHDTTDQVLAKLDYQLSPKATLSGHYGWFDQRRVDPYDPTTAFTSLPGFGAHTPKRAQHAALGMTRTAGQTVLETRVGWHSPRYSVVPESAGRDFSALLGFPSVASDPLYRGYPSIVVGGFTSMGEGLTSPLRSEGTVFNAIQNVSMQPGFLGGRHVLRFGGSFLYVTQLRSSPLYARGRWDFNGTPGQSPLETLVRGIPTRALVGQGDGIVELRAPSWTGYIGDDIRISRRLTVQTGLRYEFNRPPRNNGPELTVPDLRPESAACSPKPTCLLVPASQLGLPPSTYRSDRNNFAPRLGLAWQPPHLDWLVVRAAYGIYFDNNALGLFGTYSYNPPFSGLLAYTGDGVKTIQTVVQQAPLSALAGVYRLDPSLRDPYVQQWNFNLQFGMPHDWLLETAYVGSKGTALPGATDLNQPPEGGGARPYPQHGPILSASSRASSNYNALQARLERRFRAGASFLASYTWGKSIDDASLYQGLSQAESTAPQNSRDLRSERALSTFNTAHRLSVSYVQELPKLEQRSSLVRGILGRWQVSLIGSFNTGHPFPILRTIDQSGTGFGPGGSIRDRPDVVGDPTKAGPVAGNPDPACRSTVSQGGKAADRVGVPESWFNRCAFAAPTGLRFGNSARNNVIGPGVANIDFSLAKRFIIDERATLQLRFEAFNLVNHPQFDLPQNYFDSASFGAVTSSNFLGTTPPRQIQIGVRIQF
jgi:hypothetical protein